MRACTYALCVSGAVNTQGFVLRFLCAIYKVSFILSFERLLMTREISCSEMRPTAFIYKFIDEERDKRQCDEANYLNIQ